MIEQQRLLSEGTRLRELMDAVRQGEKDARFVGALSFGQPSGPSDVARRMRAVAESALAAADEADAIAARSQSK